jgi:hypothetical protein
VTETIPRIERPANVAELGSGKFKPVKLWATVGAAFLALETYAVTAWIVSGKATRTPTGEDPVPTYMKVFIHGWEILGIPALVVFLYFFLVRPWRREGHITTDGLFCLVFGTIWWQDPMSNWIAPMFTYNSELWNFGNWTSNIPGWFMPNSNLVGESPLWIAPLYVYLAFGAAVAGCTVMRKAKERWPQLGTFGLIGVCAGFFVFFDLVLEPTVMLMGFWTYPNAIPWLTLFHGHYYQFPIYEALMTCVGWTALSSARYFKNDKGQTFAERGIDKVRASRGQKTVLRFLALAGICNSAILFGYNIPIQFFNANGSPWIDDIKNRSYFTDGLCGPGTEYKCWGPGTPYPRGRSPHLDPGGGLVVPKG